VPTWPSRNPADPVPGWFHKGTFGAGTVGMMLGFVLADSTLQTVAGGVLGWMTGCVLFICIAVVAMRISGHRSRG
jgi:hypothetical protein